MIPGPYAGSPYYPLPGPIEAHTVLRDWLLQETGRGDLDRMSSWMLVAYGRTLGAPAGLLALAREEAAKRQRAVLEPADLHAQLRRHYPRSRVGLLTVEAIGAGIEPHIEAIAFAATLGVDPVSVQTILTSGARGGRSDEVLLTGERSKQYSRPDRVQAGQHRVRIHLPSGWKTWNRLPGSKPHPWELGLPAGWSMSGHGRWLQRLVVVGETEEVEPEETGGIHPNPRDPVWRRE